jgi:NAD(P)-dependent dehydrogenase (short-subunit alcohol dehydrogenase family)
MTTPATTHRTPRTVLITGANKGIGRETARRLAATGWTVWLGARDAELGKAAATDLAADGDDVRFLQLDVTSDTSVEAAVDTVRSESGSLDVLVNNAGIGGPRLTPADTTASDFLACFGVNLLGPVRVTHAFLPLLRTSANPNVVMVSSGLGSFAVTADPDRLEATLQGLIYQSSKAALNMVTTQYARAIPEVRFNAVDPGYTATDLNGHNGFQTVGEGSEAIVRVAGTDADGPTGGFFDRSGPVAW